MREATKSSLYRNEVTEGAARAVVAAVQRFAELGAAAGQCDAASRRGRWRPLMQQADRRIDWQRDDTQTVLRKIRAADGAPGVLDELFGAPCHLFDAHPEALAQRHPPGSVIGRRHEAVLRATARRRGLDRACAPGRPGRQLQAAHGAGVPGRGRAPARVADRHRCAGGRIGLAGDPLRGRGRCRHPALPLLQRRDEHGAMRASDGRCCALRWRSRRACCCCSGAPTSGRTAST